MSGQKSEDDRPDVAGCLAAVDQPATIPSNHGRCQRRRIFSAGRCQRRQTFGGGECRRRWTIGGRSWRQKWRECDSWDRHWRFSTGAWRTNRRARWDKSRFRWERGGTSARTRWDDSGEGWADSGQRVPTPGERTQARRGSSGLLEKR